MSALLAVKGQALLDLACAGHRRGALGSWIASVLFLGPVLSNRPGQHKAAPSTAWSVRVKRGILINLSQGHFRVGAVRWVMICPVQQAVAHRGHDTRDRQQRGQAITHLLPYRTTYLLNRDRRLAHCRRSWIR